MLKLDDLKKKRDGLEKEIAKLRKMHHFIETLEDSEDPLNSEKQRIKELEEDKLEEYKNIDEQISEMEN